MHVDGWSDDKRAGPIAADANRKCILVLGMHRSGTSALTRLLSLLGAALPKHVLVANPTNEKGHWEPAPLVHLHDAMLAEVGSRWDDWRIFDPTKLDPGRLAHYQAEIARLIMEEYGDEPLFVVKDPRLCRLMPLWRKVLAEVRVQARYAIPIRNPLEVSRSLERVYGFPPAYGWLLWLRHVLDAERETRGDPRVFVHYHDLLNDPLRTAAHIVSQLAEDRLAVNAENEREIESWIDARLRHHVAEPGQLDDRAAFHPWLRRTYEAYAALVRLPTDQAAQRWLDRVRAVFDPTCEALALLTEAPAAEVPALQETIAERNRALADLEAQLALRDEAIRALYASVSWRLTAPLRAAKRLLGRGR